MSQTGCSGPGLAAKVVLAAGAAVSSEAGAATRRPNWAQVFAASCPGRPSSPCRSAAPTPRTGRTALSAPDAAPMPGIASRRSTRPPPWFLVRWLAPLVFVHAFELLRQVLTGMILFGQVGAASAAGNDPREAQLGPPVSRSTGDRVRDVHVSGAPRTDRQGNSPRTPELPIVHAWP